MRYPSEFLLQKARQSNLYDIKTPSALFYTSTESCSGRQSNYTVGHLLVRRHAGTNHSSVAFCVHQLHIDILKADRRPACPPSFIAEHRVCHDAHAPRHAKGDLSESRLLLGRWHWKSRDQLGAPAGDAIRTPYCTWGL